MKGRKRERIFRMKQFEVRHELSSNKVGVDGVLVGAWTPVENQPKRILDAGCGCGLISLMMAQRVADAQITGIDIETNAVREAKLNAQDSPWGNRIAIQEKDFGSLSYDISVNPSAYAPFDLIVSNPPFFDSGVNPEVSSRMLARHAGTLSPAILVKHAGKMLSEGGMLSFICPATQSESLITLAGRNGMGLYRAASIRGNPNTTPKRNILVFRRQEEREDNPLPAPGTLPNSAEEILIEDAPGEYSQQYISLCRPFYTIFP